VRLALTLLAACGRVDFAAMPDAVECPATTTPPASSLVDDLSSGVLAPSWFPNAMCIAETGGELVAQVPANMQQAYCTATSALELHLTCDAITVHVPEVTTQVAGVQTVIYMFGPGDALWLLLDDIGFTLTDANHVQLDMPPGLYDPVADAWWRLREDGGTVRFDTSPDGIAWAPRAQIPDPFPLDNLRVSLGAGAYFAIANPGQARFHCFNVPPPCN